MPHFCVFFLRDSSTTFFLVWSLVRFFRVWSKPPLFLSLVRFFARLKPFQNPAILFGVQPILSIRKEFLLESRLFLNIYRSIARINTLSVFLSDLAIRCEIFFLRPYQMYASLKSNKIFLSLLVILIFSIFCQQTIFTTAGLRDHYKISLSYRRVRTYKA